MSKGPALRKSRARELLLARLKVREGRRVRGGRDGGVRRDRRREAVRGHPREEGETRRPGGDRTAAASGRPGP